MLGAVSADGQELGSRDITKRGEAELDPSEGFKWSERVRDLAARMRYLVDALGDETLTSVEREWLLRLFHHIHDSHDPSAFASTHEQVWRVWVRMELWQAAESLTTSSTDRTERARWRERAHRLRRRLGVSRLSPALRSQMRVAVKALRALT